MRIIAVEEHFITMEQFENLRLIATKEYPVKEVIEQEKLINREVPYLLAPPDKGGASRLLDVGEGRLQIMDEATIDIQVLSLVLPGVQVFDAAAGTILAKKANNRLADIIAANPTRFAGLASLAPQDPEEAAKELERAVLELGLKGANINSHTKGEYLDDKKFWPILAKAEKLGVPIYIHPRMPSPDMVKPYLAYNQVDKVVAGYGAEVFLHAIRMIGGGVFDAFPALQIVLGHLGEGLPFWLWRVDRGLRFLNLKKSAANCIRENFFVTTGGMQFLPALLCSLMALGAERILFSVDYPFESSKDTVQFIDNLQISDADKAKIFHLNSEKLFKL